MNRKRLKTVAEDKPRLQDMAEAARAARKLKLEQPVLSVFPTFNMRQAHILMQCVGLGMNDALMVDGKPVAMEEFESIINQLIRK